MDCVVLTDKVLVRPCSDLFTGWVKCTDLETAKAYGELTAPEGVEEGLHWREDKKIPADLMKKVLGTVHNYKRKETGYVIYRNGRTGEWDVRAPEQLGSPAHVSFFEEEHPDNAFQVVGTIHTHPEMGAFWSGTDLNDQTKKPGTVHMVLGLADGHVKYTKCTVFMKDAYYDIPFSELVEDVDFTEDYEPVKEWVEIIDKQSYKAPTYPAYYATQHGILRQDYDFSHYANYPGFSKTTKVCPAGSCRSRVPGSTARPEECFGMCGADDDGFDDGFDADSKSLRKYTVGTDDLDDDLKAMAMATLEHVSAIVADIASILGSEKTIETVLDTVTAEIGDSWDMDINCPVCASDIRNRPEDVLEDVLEFAVSDEGKDRLNDIISTLSRYSEYLGIEDTTAADDDLSDYPPVYSSRMDDDED